MQKSNNTRELIIFGDSLSDNGNIFHILSASSRLLSGIHMTSPPSVHDGTVFCNGTLLIEHIARCMGHRCDPAWKKEGGNNYAVSYASIFVEHSDHFLTLLFSGLDFERYSLARQVDNYIQRADKTAVTSTVFF